MLNSFFFWKKKKGGGADFIGNSYTNETSAFLTVYDLRQVNLFSALAFLLCGLFVLPT